jgi:colanic acid/amylovoran biosynthesis protein
MNVLLEAYVDSNIGDDLMLDLLVRRYPGINFWTFGYGDLAYNDRQPYRDWKNFFLIGRAAWETLLNSFDGYLGLGGSMWQDYGKVNAFLIRDRTTRRMSELGRPRLMIGNNIGPVSTPAGEALFIDLLELLDDITLRDQASFDWIKARSRRVNARLAADPVFLYPVPGCTRQAGLVGVSVNNNPKAPDRNEPYAESIARLVAQLVSAGSRVRLFGFDSGAEDDGAIISRVLAKLPVGAGPGAVEQCIYQGDIPAFLAAFGACEHVFASRFHALVLALRFGIPFTPFAYLDKTASLLKDLGYRGPLFNYDNLASGIDVAVAHIHGRRVAYDMVALVAMKARAERNFTRADQLLQAQAEPGLRPLIFQLIRQREADARALKELHWMQDSFYWRLTRPLRWLAGKARSKQPRQ